MRGVEARCAGEWVAGRGERARLGRSCARRLIRDELQALLRSKADGRDRARRRRLGLARSLVVRGRGSEEGAQARRAQWRTHRTHWRPRASRAGGRRPTRAATQSAARTSSSSSEARMPSIAPSTVEFVARFRRALAEAASAARSALPDASASRSFGSSACCRDDDAQSECFFLAILPPPPLAGEAPPPPGALLRAFFPGPDPPLIFDRAASLSFIPRRKALAFARHFTCTCFRHQNEEPDAFHIRMANSARKGLSLSVLRRKR